jgi:integrase
MVKILPSDIQAWVTQCCCQWSVPQEHPQVPRDVALGVPPSRPAPDHRLQPVLGAELPKVVKKRGRTLTPHEYRRVIDAIPAQHRLMSQVAIETGLHWGELIALRPRHIEVAQKRPIRGQLLCGSTQLPMHTGVSPNGYVTVDT